LPPPCRRRRTFIGTRSLTRPDEVFRNNPDTGGANPWEKPNSPTILTRINSENLIMPGLLPLRGKPRERAKDAAGLIAMR
jgi:hypothetical protein